MMASSRIWHLMAMVAAAAILFAIQRFESRCTPVSPLLACLYVCGFLGIRGARARGRRWHHGLLFGLLLGPIGVILAWSNPVPQGFPTASGKGNTRHLRDN
jgi:hypothetical protein